MTKATPHYLEKASKMTVEEVASFLHGYDLQSSRLGDATMTISGYRVALSQLREITAKALLVAVPAVDDADATDNYRAILTRAPNQQRRL